MSLLRVKSVTKKFGGLTANEDVSFSIDIKDKAKIVALIGPNGAGKTTLFNCVAGYSPATSGEIWLNDINITSFTPEECARVGIGRTFQVARTFTSMTALENVMVGAFLHDRNVATARKAAEELLEFVNLGKLKNKVAADITISEQRRLAVARALAVKPKLLLMDEVMAGLTEPEMKIMIDVVFKIRDRGISCLIVEHVLEQIWPITDQVVVLYLGKKLADDKPEIVRANEEVRKKYTGDE